MEAFALLRAVDRSAAIAAAATSSTAQQGATVRFLAGGTTLVDLMKLGVERPEVVVDINRLALDRIETGSDGGLAIGATARNSELAHHPHVVDRYAALSQAILAGASGQLRNAATTAGNLLQRTRCHYFRDVAAPCNKRHPGSGCPAIAGSNRLLAILGTSEACIAVHPSDMAVAMTAYEAVVHVEHRGGTRGIPIGDFFLLPGDRPDRENVLEPGDLVTHVALPPRPAGERSTYLKLRDRASYQFALVSTAAAVAMDDGTIANVRLALGGVGTRPWRAAEAETVLAGKPPSDAVFREAADAALAGARPQRENGFKVELARRCIVHALRQVAG